MKTKLGKYFLAATSLLVLAGCSDIVAKPENYDDNIVNVEGDALANNIEKLVYMQLHDSSKYGNDVSELVFHKIFEERFGSLKEIEEVAEKTADEILAYVDNHKGFQELDVDGNRITTDAAKTLEVANVKRTAKYIEKETYETLFDELDTSSNKEDNLYQERLFALSVFKNLYEIKNAAGELVTSADQFDELDFYEDVLITDNVKLWDEDTDSFVANQKLLHLEYYEDYITRYVNPDIEEAILVGQYIYNQNYSALGRKYARDIDIIAIPELSPVAGEVFTWGDTSALCLKFAEWLADEDTTNDDFEILAAAYRGIDIGDGYWAKAQQLLDEAGFAKENVNADDVEALSTDAEREEFNQIQPSYYLGTIYGNNMYDFLKITNKVNEQTKSIEQTYSGNGSYAYFHGFELKARQNMLESYTKGGWALKAGSAYSLPDDIKNRLFNINVALDFEDPTDSKYLQEVGSAGKYLIPDDTGRDNQYPYLWYVNSTYYLVKVNEAASTTKLNKSEDNPSSYTNMKQDFGVYNDDVAYEIINLMSSDSTTKSNALLYILENSEINYHDQDIYDYFKSTYPDLFDND